MELGISGLEVEAAIDQFQLVQQAVHVLLGLLVEGLPIRGFFLILGNP